MKHFKKVITLLLAAMMILSMSAVAFAAAGDLTVDANVTVTGIEKGDTVTAYQFITWDSANNQWKVADGVGLTLDQITDGLTKAELATLASHTDKMTAVTDGGLDTAGTTWTKTCGTVATAGSYLILVTDNDVKHIYNPAVVSADFSEDSANTVALTPDAAYIKKQNVTAEKDADDKPDDYDVQVGDIVPFTVKVTVPQYNDNWTEPTFEVKDELSTGLTLEVLPTIDGLTAGADYTLSGAKGDRSFTITFSENYLKTHASAAIDIKYSAKVGEAVKDTAQIHEETNKVTLKYSNDPTNKDSHKEITDETHHYTFAIDSNAFGSTSDKTTELIKVGIDENGEPITVYKTTETPATVSPLAGATFTLTGVGANGAANGYSQEFTTGSDGRITFNNLEVGTYTLTETKAPAGYVKDPDSHQVVITAQYNDDSTLKSYTITIDGKATSTYTATLKEDKTLDTLTPSDDNQTFPINNKKGASLPSTGGIGTVIFYTLGTLLVVGCGIVLVSRRRMQKNK